MSAGNGPNSGKLSSGDGQGETGEQRGRDPAGLSSVDHESSLPAALLTRSGAIAAGIPFVTITLLGVDSAGYFPPAWGWAALGLLAVCAVMLLVGEEWPLERVELVAVGGLAALVLLMLVGVTWSHDVTETVLSAERALVYPAALLAALLSIRSSSVESALVGVLAAACLLSSAGLLSKLVPGLLGAQRDPIAHGQLYVPIGYWNGLGIVAGIGIVLSVGVALRRRRRNRLPWFAAAGLLALTLALTQSRGAALAVAAGVLTCLALRGDLRRPSPRLFAGLVAVIALVVVLTVTHTLGGAPGGGPTSLTGRGDLWSVALTEAAHHPVLGGGAGTWPAYWARYRAEGHNIGDANSLYIEALGELGLAGLALVLVGLAPPVWMVWRFGARGAAPAAAGAYVAFLVHAAVDLDWKLPAVTVAGLWCGAAVLAEGRRGTGVPLTRDLRAAALAACALAAVAAAVGLVGNRYIARSAADLAVGRYQSAALAARAASSWMPWSYQPAVWEGEAELASRDQAAARIAFRDALSKPSGTGVWRLWWDVSRASSGARQLHALANVVRLNPRSPELRVLCASPRTAALAPLEAFCDRWRTGLRAHRRV